MAKSPTNPDQAHPMQSQAPEKADHPLPYASGSPLRSTQPGNSSSTTTTSPASATPQTTTDKPSLIRTWLNFFSNLFTRSPESAASRRQKKAQRRRSQRVRAREKELRTKRAGPGGFYFRPGGVGASAY